jgi:hypothetical protein
MKAIASDHLQKFYYSNRRIKEKRTQKLQTRKVKDSICAAEINKVYSSAIKALMLVVLSKVILEKVVSGFDKNIVELVRRVHFVILK